jgi:protein gp37
MGENSTIEWTDHTFNPWTGCQRVSPGCDHCYAEALAKRSPRTFGSWQPGGERKRTSEAYWRQPLAWNTQASFAGRRDRVFCASMADVFDTAAPADWLADLLVLVKHTPALDWLLLTKRPQLIRRQLREAAAVARVTGRNDVADWVDQWLGGEPPAQVWLGTTVENQAEADRRIPHLRSVPARVRFLSCEPLLGPLNLMRAPAEGGGWDNWLTGDRHRGNAIWSAGPGIDWVIAGGESGLRARSMRPDWAHRLRDQCVTAGVPFFFKQWGAWAPRADGVIEKTTKDKTGALLDGREWREVPRA